MFILSCKTFRIGIAKIGENGRVKNIFRQVFTGPNPAFAKGANFRIKFNDYIANMAFSPNFFTGHDTSPLAVAYLDILHPVRKKLAPP